METLEQRQTGTSDAPKRTRLFQNGNSQAVRIPKALAFDSVGVEVEIERRGEELIVRPARRKLTGLGAAFRKLRPHFRGYRRDQPVQAERGGSGHQPTRMLGGYHRAWTYPDLVDS